MNPTRLSLFHQKSLSTTILAHLSFPTFPIQNEDNVSDDEAEDARATAVRAKEDGAEGQEVEGETLHAQDLDAYWLQRQIAKAFNGALDAAQAQQTAEDVFGLLAGNAVRKK